MSKQIQLTKGYVTIVDDEDHDWLMKYSWHVHDSRSRYYYARSRVKGKMTRMHRLILQRYGLLEDSKQVDHIDGDGLNNQKSNLRACTNAENRWNAQRVLKNGRRGISRAKSKKNPWMAQINVNGKRIYLGVFPTKEAAARAYDDGARKYHGEFATLNFPQEKSYDSESPL